MEARLLAQAGAGTSCSLSSPYAAACSCRTASGPAGPSSGTLQDTEGQLSSRTPRSGRPVQAGGVTQGVGQSGKCSPIRPRLGLDVHRPFPKTRRLHQRTGTLSTSGTPHPSQSSRAIGSAPSMPCQQGSPACRGRSQAHGPVCPLKQQHLAMGMPRAPCAQAFCALPAVVWLRAGLGGCPQGQAEPPTVGNSRGPQWWCQPHTSLVSLRMPLTSRI